jgi:kynurenine formamidase
MCVPGTAEAVRARLAEADGEPERPASGLSRRAALAAGAGALAAGLMPSTAAAGHGHGRGRGRGHGRRRGKLVDLTHTFREDFALYPGSPEGNARTTERTIAQHGFYGQQWTFWEHTATHMDVPGHFVAGGRTSDEIALEELIRPIVVVDISGRAAREPATEVTEDDLRRFERRHGRIPKGALVAMNSGWDAKAGDTEAFINDMQFPGFSGAATQWLLEERKIGGIGVDTLSLDNGPSESFASHLAVLGADKVGIENLANLGELPPRGATVVMGLIPWKEGSGGPARVLATY